MEQFLDQRELQSNPFTHPLGSIPYPLLKNTDPAMDPLLLHIIPSLFWSILYKYSNISLSF